jgi:hypothetical protein
MSGHRELKAGDRVRLLHVPPGCLARRDRERREGVEDAGWTADTIERILRQDPNVTVDRVDAYGHPWFNYNLAGDDGTAEEHTLAITVDGWWTLA